MEALMSLFFPRSHADYTRWLEQTISFPRLRKKRRKILRCFSRMDLSSVDELLAVRFSKFGPRSYRPSDLLRSCLLAVRMHVTSITKWVEALHDDPFCAALSGFQQDAVPSVGTFYNFAARLWDADSANVSPHVRPKKPVPKKPDKRGEKAACTEPTSMDELLDHWQRDPLSKPIPYWPLAAVFSLFLKRSCKEGLISADALSLAGDGTPVCTSARQRKHRVCSCKAKGIEHCDCDRHYSQPDCDIGWDSSRSLYFNGYNLYLLTAADSSNDLPIFPLLVPASRHDSMAFVDAFFLFRMLFGPSFHVTELLLDSAHDAMPLYRYCKQVGITPFIDLNARRSGKGTTVPKDSFHSDTDGTPICPAGKRMHRDGTEKARERLKFRCPCIRRCSDGTKQCVCAEPCTDSKYGPVLHVPLAQNPRLYNTPPRGSKAWRKEYAKRTSAERANKRIKIDFLLESGKHRSSRMWYFRLYTILMLLHACAWKDSSAVPPHAA